MATMPCFPNVLLREVSDAAAILRERASKIIRDAEDDSNAWNKANAEADGLRQIADWIEEVASDA